MRGEPESLRHPDMASEQGTPTQLLSGAASYRHQVEAKPGFPTEHALHSDVVLIPTLLLPIVSYGRSQATAGRMHKELQTVSAEQNGEFGFY